MANRYAVATGNWSNTAIWDGGTLPQAGDDVRANGFTVTIDQDISVTSIQTTALAPAVAGGVFVINSSGRTITANIIAGTTTCLTYNGGFTLSIVGNIFAGPAAIGASSNNTGSVLTLVGNITSGTGFGVHGLSTSGTVNMTGDCIGANGNNNALNLSNSSAVANITGNVLGGGTSRGIDSPSIGGTSINITGNVIGGATSANAIGQVGISANIVVNGNIIGGNGGVGILMNGGTLTGNFVVYGSPTATAVGLSVISGTAIVKQIAFSNIGTAPVSGRILFDNTTQIVTVLKQNNTTANLVDISGAAYPVPANVRQGTSYASGLYTGTLVVPPANAVNAGVVYDNGTVGTGFTAAQFLNEISSSSDPLAVRLKNVVTTDILGAQIAAYSP